MEYFFYLADYTNLPNKKEKIFIKSQKHAG